MKFGGVQNDTFEENSHANERIWVILGCAISFIARAKHGCTHGWPANTMVGFQLPKHIYRSAHQLKNAKLGQTEAWTKWTPFNIFILKLKFWTILIIHIICAMIRWICGTRHRVETSKVSLLQKLGIEDITAALRAGSWDGMDMYSAAEHASCIKFVTEENVICKMLAIFFSTSMCLSTSSILSKKMATQTKVWKSHQDTPNDTYQWIGTRLWYLHW